MQKTLPLIIGCKVKVYNELWGSSNTNVRSEYFLKCLIKENLTITIILEICTSTFKTKVREEVLDITIISPNIKNFISNRRVSAMKHLCHSTILFDLMGQSDKQIGNIINHEKLTGKNLIDLQDII